MLNTWSDYKSLNVLPYGGSDLMEQPAFILEAFKAIEEEKTSTELKQNQEALKRAQRRQ
tara:strand:- start:4387 stop:4563 length:177 start_codon:yes stop_codon:yes gene_type:complete